MLEYKPRPATLEFLAGLFAGIGIILLTMLFAFFLGIALDSHLDQRTASHIVAGVWFLSAFGFGALVFWKRSAAHRRSSFTAGLVTAAAFLLLLTSACWNFYFQSG